VEEADRLANACASLEERLIVWTLLDTGLRVSELCTLSSQRVLWQQRALQVSGKGGPHGTHSKQRVVPMSRRVQALLEPYFTLNDA
jgi:integrase/recombinase XerD